MAAEELSEKYKQLSKTLLDTEDFSYIMSLYLSLTCLPAGKKYAYRLA